MKLFTWVILTCYIALFILTGVALVAFSFHLIPLEPTTYWLEIAYTERNVRAICFVTGAGLILLNWVYAQLALARFQRQKTIAFENPDGQVTVSLAAIEDYLRRSSQDLPEVKELRSDVVARKGKIVVRVRAVLWAGVQIPEAAERVQSMVKSKVQEMLAGVEEPVIVRLHVANVVRREEKGSAPERKLGQFAPPYRSGY